MLRDVNCSATLVASAEIALQDTDLAREGSTLGSTYRVRTTFSHAPTPIDASSFQIATVVQWRISRLYSLTEPQ